MATYEFYEGKLIAMSWKAAKGFAYTEDPWDLAIAQWKLDHDDNAKDEEPF